MLTLTLLLACNVVTGPTYVNDFAVAFCDYQSRCGDPVALNECGEPQILSVDACIDFVERSHSMLAECTWNAEFATDCITAYESLPTCPSEGAPHPSVCAQVYTGGPDCAAFPYPVCDAGTDTDTGQTETGGSDTSG